MKVLKRLLFVSLFLPFFILVSICLLLIPLYWIFTGKVLLEILFDSKFCDWLLGLPD